MAGRPSRQPFPIVGIGASAGGLDAFRQLLGALATDAGMAYVLVQHLDPRHDSILAELLSEITHMSVSEVKRDVSVEAGRVYVIPPSGDIAFADGMLRLVPRAGTGSAHMPIDSFLRSLAAAQGSRGIGVILSGMGSDGTLGLEAIKEAGGITFAQDPRSARNGDMPRSAIAAGCVDFVLPPEGIARELNRLGGQRDDAVTSFFRDGEVFQAMAERVLPAFFEDRAAEAPIRVWVPGCSSGEEVYSIAICLVEAAGNRPSHPAFQIFGTDLSDSALGKARAGLYPESIAQHVSPERLRRFFSRVDGQYQISKVIREMCVFAHHDVTRDPPFSRMDLISCQNVLSDLEPRMQAGALATFHHALSASGFLVLGPAESPGETSALFSPLDEEHRIYARTASIGPHGHAAPRADDQRRVPETPLAPRAVAHSEVPREADRLLLVRYGPPSVVVDESLDILEFRGDTDPFLEHAHGQATLNLTRMVRKGLLVALRQAIAEVRRDGTPSRKAGLRIGYGERLHTVSLEVIPIKGHAAAERCLLILFEKEPVSTRARRGRALLSAATHAARPAEREVARLEHKLEETTDYLHTVVREHEAAVEELQSTNEETLSSNEELQSVNEELQTAKEEIQSTNEELANLNQELQDRNLTLAQTNDDLLNLLGSVNIPVVMVGDDLRVRRFTPAAQKLFTLAAGDVGKPLGEVRNRLQAPELEHEIRSVLETATVSEREVLDRDGRFHAMKIWPYMTRAGRIDGAVLVIVDVDDLKRAADQIQRALDRANAIVATVREPLLILDGELRVEKANRAYFDTFRVGPHETHGQRLGALGSGQWGGSALRAALAEVMATEKPLEGFEVEDEFPGLGRRTMAINARCLYGEGGSRGLLVAIEDLTESKLDERRRTSILALEHAARERAEAADHLKDEFVATVSHELRGPLTVIAGWTHILAESRGHADEDTLAKAVGAIDRSVTTQSRLIADLLDHSRLVSGKVQLSRSPIDLLAVAEAAMEGVRAAAEAKDITIDLSGDPAASIVLGDFDRMQQVLWNLFFNAVKFTPRGGRIAIWGGRVETHVHLTVTDSGQGIGADFLPHVFDRFRQKESSLLQTQTGLGLGLTLVRDLVALHGGTVKAESEGEGRGATFTVALPIPALLLEPKAPMTIIERASRPVPVSAPEPECRPLAGLSVLVVDDDPDVRDALKGVLERHGARVRAAAAVGEAMMAVREAVPDVLVSDLGMPGDDGFELIRQVRMLPSEAGGTLPAVAVSAYARESDLHRALAAGFRVHLSKPVTPAELVDQVARAAGRALSR